MQICPLVTVIIAVRNGERYVREAIESILSQTYPHYEVVVVDGHSTDNTLAILQGYPGLRLLQQPDQGLAAAWNLGIAAAQGDLITFLDADDSWPPEKLSLQVKHLSEYPTTEAVIGKVRFFLAEEITHCRGARDHWLKADQVGRIPGTLMVRATTLSDVGNFSSDLKIAADVDWFARAKDRHMRLDVLPDVVLHKRLHADNLSMNPEANNRELLNLLHHSIRRQRLESGT